MAKLGQTNLLYNDLDIYQAPTTIRNFVRVMAAMSVPPDSQIYDVTPKNGIKPMLYNHYEGHYPCIGYVDVAESYVDDDNEQIVIVIREFNTQSTIVSGLEDANAYIGGKMFSGLYDYADIGDNEYRHLFKVDIAEDEYNIFNVLKTMSLAQYKIPVWHQSSGGEEITMDFYADWSNGMSIAPIPAGEYTGFTAAETVAVKDGTDQICEWRKLCNATGMSFNVDSANNRMNLSCTTGIITAGKPSANEPVYWMIELTDSVFMRIYLNVHEINYRMLGRYAFNAGQGHDYLYLRDPSVMGDLSVDGDTCTFTITMPDGSPLMANFWDYLLAVVYAETEVSFVGGIHIHGFDKEGDIYAYYDCIIARRSGEWVVAFTVPSLTFESGTDMWADIKVLGINYIRELSTEVVPGEYSIVSFDAGEDDIIDTMSVYAVESINTDNTYTLTWSSELQEWHINETDEDIIYANDDFAITSRIMSFDTAEFSRTLELEEEGTATDEGTAPSYDVDDSLTDIFTADNGIYPQSVYYFRLKCMWQDLVCGIEGIEQEIKNADIYRYDVGEEIMGKYGIYALCNYNTDEDGNYSRKIDQDDTSYDRYCGIYGRNFLCRPADIPSDGWTLYPPNTEYNIYYPPQRNRVLLTRADNGETNAIEYVQTPNSITFDLTEQTIGASRDPQPYAGYDWTPELGGSTLSFQYHKPGISGNGFAIDIIVTAKVNAITVIEPIDDVLKVFLPYGGSTLAAIYAALNPRMDVDYNITTILTGDGAEAIAANITLTLTGGGDEMVVSNNPLYRDLEDVYRHPGYMFNSSRKRPPINMVGIYAVYLSGNYAYAGNFVDVVAIDTDMGPELYAALYSGTDPEDSERYTLVSDIKPIDDTYTDVDIAPQAASCNLPLTGGGSLVLEAAEPGWDGNAIVFKILWVDAKTYDLSWGGDHHYDENIEERKIILYARTEDGLPKVLLTDDFITLLGEGKLLESSHVGSAEMDLTEDIYYLSGGGVGSTSAYIHYHGYILGLKHVGAGVFDIVRDTEQEDRWLFKDSKVDLLLYKLENTDLGVITKDSILGANQWTIDASAILETGDMTPQEIFDDIVTPRDDNDVMNYIDIDGYEIPITNITYDDGVHEFTITTTDAGQLTILKALRYKKSVPCMIRDIYTVTTAPQESINKAMIYYGRYQPKITVQIPSVAAWAPTLVPYYIIRLEYGSNRS